MKRYGFMFDATIDDGHHLAWETVEGALDAAREYDPEAERVFVFETQEFIPNVWWDYLLAQLRDAANDAWGGENNGFLAKLSEQEGDSLSRHMTDAFVAWAKENAVRYWVDVPQMETVREYDLLTGKPVV